MNLCDLAFPCIARLLDQWQVEPALWTSVSPSTLAVVTLGGSPDRLLWDLELLGLLFASLVIRDLRVLAQALDGTVFHDRDACGVEVDASAIKLGPG